tara:strand:- start:210 stop:362 length:153 start_codon:yes stop_codon:yes gene_type:complete
MKYTIHFKSVEIDQEEYVRFLKFGFYDWLYEQAELKNINYDYVTKEEQEQ